MYEQFAQGCTRQDGGWDSSPRPQTYLLQVQHRMHDATGPGMLGSRPGLGLEASLQRAQC